MTEKLARKQDGRLYASPSALGRTRCKRERYEATEPVHLAREDCTILLESIVADVNGKCIQDGMLPCAEVLWYFLTDTAGEREEIE